MLSVVRLPVMNEYRSMAMKSACLQLVIQTTANNAMATTRYSGWNASRRRALPDGGDTFELEDGINVQIGETGQPQVSFYFIKCRDDEEEIGSLCDFNSILPLPGNSTFPLFDILGLTNDRAKVNY